MAYAHLFSLRKMQAFIIINEIIKIAVLLYFFGNLAGRGKKRVPADRNGISGHCYLLCYEAFL